VARRRQIHKKNREEARSREKGSGADSGRAGETPAGQCTAVGNICARAIWAMKEEVVFRTPDHPEANGRVPLKGETEYVVRFPTEDGKELVVRCGQKGYDNLGQLLLDMMANAPSYGDGDPRTPDERKTAREATARSGTGQKAGAVIGRGILAEGERETIRVGEKGCNAIGRPVELAG
jgi:hypothetical protein